MSSIINATLSISEKYLVIFYDVPQNLCSSIYRTTISNFSAKFKLLINETKKVIIMSDILKELGKKIKIIREREGLTLEKLAYENDISKGYMSEIEKGIRNPSVKVLEKIANGLNVKIRDLF